MRLKLFLKSVHYCLYLFLFSCRVTFFLNSSHTIGFIQLSLPLITGSLLLQVFHNLNLLLHLDKGIGDHTQYLNGGPDC